MLGVCSADGVHSGMHCPTDACMRGYNQRSLVTGSLVSGYNCLLLSTAGKLRAAPNSGDAGRHCLHLCQAVTCLRFIKQCVLAMDTVDQLLMERQAGSSMQDAIATVTAKLPTLETQLSRARTQASILGDASSSLQLRRVCQLMESSVLELEQQLTSFCQQQDGQEEQADQQHPAGGAVSKRAAAIRCLATQLKQKLTAFQHSMSNSEQQKLEEVTRQEVVQYLVQCQQTDIEGQVATMLRWQEAIRTEASSSSQRAKLRQKLTQGEVQLKRLVEDYNTLAGAVRSRQLPEADLDAVKQGEYPWQFDGVEPGALHQVPLKLRLEVCQKWQWLHRTREGQQHVLQGMLNFVHYYQALLVELQNAATSSASDSTMLPAYRLGMSFCQQQLKAAEAFAVATGGKFTMPEAGAGVHAAEQARRVPLLRHLAWR